MSAQIAGTLAGGGGSGDAAEAAPHVFQVWFITAYP